LTYDFPRPLVLERRRADDDGAPHALVVHQPARRGNRLHRLAQAHVVGQERATVAGQERHALDLVRKQARAHAWQLAAVLLDFLAHAGDALAAGQVLGGAARVPGGVLAQRHLQLHVRGQRLHVALQRIPGVGQRAAQEAAGVEVPVQQALCLGQRRRAAHPHRRGPRHVPVEVDHRHRRSQAALLLPAHAVQHGFDVLARAQSIDREVPPTCLTGARVAGSHAHRVGWQAGKEVDSCCKPSKWKSTATAPCVRWSRRCICRRDARC
jgi:hypothetical protein